MRGFEEGVLEGGRRVHVARSARSRLLGLALLRKPPTMPLLIPRCSCVHTFGMRFALDLEFLDARGRTLAVRRGVGPWRIARRRGAAAVIESASRSSR